jgi:hypothetical protein
MFVRDAAVSPWKLAIFANPRPSNRRPTGNHSSRNKAGTRVLHLVFSFFRWVDVEILLIHDVGNAYDKWLEGVLFLKKGDNEMKDKKSSQAFLA